MQSLNPETMSDEQIKNALDNVKTIAVVGLSPDTSSESFKAAAYLKERGYRIIPVTIHAHKILDELCHHELNSIQEPLDIVYYFPHPDEVVQRVDVELEELIRQSKLMNIGTMVLHEGTTSERAARQASEAGVTLVQDTSLAGLHSRVCPAA